MIRLLRWALQLFVHNSILFWTVVIANVLGVLIGVVIWYGDMLLQSPIWAWPFIPDCPLAALGGTIALFLVRSGRRAGWFFTFVAFGCLKYGLWTLLFWGQKWRMTGEILPLEVLLFLTHVGLAIEGLLLVVVIDAPTLWKRLSVIGWFGLSVCVDYLLKGFGPTGDGFHPPLAPGVTHGDAFVMAVAMTAVIGLGCLLLPLMRGAVAAVPIRTDVVERAV